MLYLKANPLLREPLTLEHIKPRLLGHWGSDAGQAFTYIHFNRLIKKYDLNAIYISGPGHGAPAVLSQAYLEGTYSEIYPEKSEDTAGLQRFFKQFSFPGGIGSHATPETPGSIHEGGELGYSISHAYGTVYDNPDLITLVMVGDGESETGPLATSWHSNKFLNPISDGAVLPVLHLNGYKINNPTILARISHDELKALFVGYGYTPVFRGRQRSRKHAPGDGRHPGALCPGDPRDPGKGAAERQGLSAALADGHPAQSQGLDRAARGGRALPRRLLAGTSDPDYGRRHQPRPLEVAGKLAAQLPAGGALRRQRAPGPRSEGPGPHGKPADERQPDRQWRSVAQAARHARLPGLRCQGRETGATLAGNVPTLGNFLREVTRLNMGNFRVFGPDETQSNRLEALYDVTKKVWLAEYFPEDADGGNLAPEGRVMEMLSEHTVEGWLEGLPSERPTWSDQQL